MDKIDFLSSGDRFLNAISRGHIEDGIPDDPFFFDELFDMATSPINLALVASEVIAPGNPLATGLLLRNAGQATGRFLPTAASSVGARTAAALGGETIVSGAATAAGLGAAHVAGKLPGPLDKLAVPAALAGGLAGGLGTVRAFRTVTGPRVPLQVGQSVFHLAAEQGADPKLIARVAKLDDFSPQFRARNIQMGEAELDVALDLIDGTLLNGLSGKVREAAVLSMALGEEIKRNPLVPRTGLRNMANGNPVARAIANMVAPVEGKAEWLSDAMFHHRGTGQSLDLVMGNTVRDFDARIKDLTGIKDVGQLFDDAGRLATDHIKFIGPADDITSASFRAGGYAEDVFLRPEMYDFSTVELRRTIEEIGQTLNQMQDIKRAAGANFKASDEFFGHRQWIEDPEVVAARMAEHPLFKGTRTGRRLSSERFDRSLTFMEGIEKELTPAPGGFLDKLRFEWNDVSRKFAATEGERLARESVPDYGSMRGHLRTRQLIKETAVSRRTAKAELAALTARYERQLGPLRRASGAAREAVKTSEARVGRARAEVKLGAAAREAKLLEFDAAAEATRKANNHMIDLLIKKQGRDENSIFQRLMKVNTQVARLRNVSNLRELRRVQAQIEAVTRRVHKGQMSAVKGGNRAAKILDDFLDGDHKALKRSMIRREANITNAERFKDFESALIKARNERLPFPGELTPLGFDDTQLRTLHENLLGKARELDGLNSKQKGLIEGSKITPEARREAALRAEEFKAAIDSMETVGEGARQIGRGMDSARELVLTADLSVLGIQGLARFIQDPVRGTRDIVQAVRFATSPEGFRMMLVAKADQIADFKRHGLEVFGGEMPTELAGATLLKGTKQQRTFVEKLPVLGDALRGFNNAAYGRAVTYLKIQSMQASIDMLSNTQASKGWVNQVKQATGIQSVNKGWSNAHIKRAAADYTNNVFGGLNPAKLGRSGNQREWEKLLVLTPDYLRATVGLAASAGRNVPEGVLARDFLARAFGMAAAASVAMALVSGKDPREINILHPNQKDWMFMSVPDPIKGGAININPFGRFRTLFRTLFVGPSELAESGDIGLAVNRSLDAAGRFAQGRFATVGGTIMNISSDKDFFGNPIRTQGGFHGRLEQAAFAAKQFTPIFAQSVLEEGIGLQSIPELVGISNFRTEVQENQAIKALSIAARDAGVPEELVKEALRRGRNPLNAEDGNGQRILDSVARSAAIEQAVESSGLDEDLIRRRGKDERAQTVEGKEAALSNSYTTFFNYSREVKEAYNSQRNQVEAAVLANPSPASFSAYSRSLTQLRQERRARYAIQRDESPAGVWTEVLKDLNDPSKKQSQNEKDALYELFNDFINREEFTTTDEQGIQFDFQAREDAIEVMRSDPVVGPFVDEFLARGDANKTALELERDTAFQKTLAPYWNAPAQVWEQVGGTRFAESFEAFEAANSGNPFLSRMGLVRQYNSTLRALRERMRLTNPSIDAALVKWLEFQPIRNRR
jgi:hypothetical protein